MRNFIDSSIAIPAEMQAVTRQRAAASYRSHSHAVAVRVDRLFALIMVVQWVAAIVAAVTITPLTWIGPISSVHFHVASAIIIGGCLCFPPVAFVLSFPGGQNQSIPDQHMSGPFLRAADPLNRWAHRNSF
jgi:hypothetical protein